MDGEGIVFRCEGFFAAVVGGGHVGGLVFGLMGGRGSVCTVACVEGEDLVSGVVCRRKDKEEELGKMIDGGGIESDYRIRLGKSDFGASFSTHISKAYFSLGF